MLKKKVNEIQYWIGDCINYVTYFSYALRIFPLSKFDLTSVSIFDESSNNCKQSDNLLLMRKYSSNDGKNCETELLSVIILRTLKKYTKYIKNSKKINSYCSWKCKKLNFSFIWNFKLNFYKSWKFGEDKSRLDCII